MDARWAALLLLVTFVAGCSGDADPETAGDTQDDAAFEELGAKATAITGIIRGVVVDDRIAPIEGADITLTGADTNRSAVSDGEGRFAFADLQPGTYFLLASTLLHLESRTAVEVVAGVDEPPIAKLQLERRFSQEPFVEPYKYDGFIFCNQAGIVYGTAPCVTDFSGLASSDIPEAARPCVEGVRCCTAAGCFPELRRVQSETRGFTQALGAGWQTLVWEMQWTETSDTFTQLGVTVSYNETERCACHNFASLGSESPFRLQIDLGVDHENSASAEPELIPPEGLPAMYFFVGVRDGPAVAYSQQFDLFVHFFYYGVPPEGWSFTAGDSVPF